jgi:catechol 2,3-dioxygenase-like lactoylglutathione lyase family enzyme
VNPDLASQLGLPPIDQVAWVVRDLDRALETFGALFGEFQTMEHAIEGAEYRGRKADVTLKMGFGRSGPLEIELIEVVSGESPHREMLEKNGEGVHHIRFKLDDIAPPLSKLLELGFVVIWSHEIPQFGARWAYLEGPAEHGGALVELYELNGPPA